MDIINISWIRNTIILTFNKKSDCSIYLVNDKKKYEFKLDGQNELKINLSNLNGDMIENGLWHLEIDEKKVKIQDKLICQFDDLSRIFKYRGNTCALLINLEVDDDYTLFLNANYMIKNKKYHKYTNLAESKNFKSLIKNLLKKFLIICINLFYKFLRLFINSDNKVLLLSDNSPVLQGNLKYTYESLKDEFKVCCLTQDIYDGHGLLKKELKEFLAILKAKYIIIDSYNSLLTILNISPSQEIIQIWHAGVGFKAVGYARFGKPGSPHPFVSSHRKYNHAIVDSEKLIPIYEEVFGCKKDIFKVDRMPRLNNYLNKDTIKEKQKELYNVLKIDENKKIILFSPTYRGTGARNASYDYSKMDFDQINEFCLKNNFVFIIKMHPFIRTHIDIKDEYVGQIYELSDYDINDLIYISDIMITDYSSCAYEFSFFDKPLIFYRYDKYLYEFLRPIHTLDAFTSKQYEVLTFDDLMRVLTKLKNEKKVDNIDKFINENETNCDIIKGILRRGNKQ